MPGDAADLRAHIEFPLTGRGGTGVEVSAPPPPDATNLLRCLVLRAVWLDVLRGEAAAVLPYPRPVRRCIACTRRWCRRAGAGVRAGA